jgi:subtilisin-like proprotein convertase family protein
VTSGQGIGSDASLNRVVRYDGTTGEMLDLYATGPEQFNLAAAAFGPDGNLYVSSAYNESILRYSGPLTGTATVQLSVTVLDVSTYSSTTQQKITSGKVVRSTITVPQTFTVADVNVKIDIDHTFNRDLRAFLINPSGTRVELFTHVGSSGDNFRSTVIDDEARLPFERGVAPFTGAFYPEGIGAQRLSLLDGEGAHGVWTLEITDSFKQDNGALRSWSLTLARANNVLQTAPAGLSDQADMQSTSIGSPNRGSSSNNRIGFIPVSATTSRFAALDAAAVDSLLAHSADTGISHKRRLLIR